MALLHKFRFLGPLPTLSRLYGERARATPPVMPAETAPEETVSEEQDWSDPDIPLDDLRDELEGRGVDVKPQWNRQTLLRHLEGK